MNTKIHKFFSWTLFGRDCKSNFLLTLIILLVMCLMCTVLTTAAHIVSSSKVSSDVEDSEEVLFTHLTGLAVYDQMTGSNLSAEDFMESGDKNVYEQAFAMLNASGKLDDELSIDDFEKAIEDIDGSEISLDTCVSEFEYAYALAQNKGVFSGDDLSIEDMMKTTLSVMGVSSDIVDSMSEMDTSSMLNTMYFKVVGLLPIFLLIVLFGNSLIVSQVDKGSMAYILATPTKRTAVAITQAVFMIVVPAMLFAIVACVRVGVITYLEGSANIEMICTLYLGMYLVTEVTAAICYFAGCIFNTSGKAIALGGGVAVWFFLASFLGVFGSEDLVNMGVGVEEMGIFNNLTITSLIDIPAIQTVGTSSVDASFVTGFVVLCVCALALYIVGAAIFNKRDLPL